MADGGSVIDAVPIDQTSAAEATAALSLTRLALIATAFAAVVMTVGVRKYNRHGAAWHETKKAVSTFVSVSDAVFFVALLGVWLLLAITLSASEDGAATAESGALTSSLLFLLEPVRHVLLAVPDLFTAREVVYVVSEKGTSPVAAHGASYDQQDIVERLLASDRLSEMVRKIAQEQSQETRERLVVLSQTKLDWLNASVEQKLREMREESLGQRSDIEQRYKDFIAVRVKEIVEEETQHIKESLQTQQQQLQQQQREQSLKQQQQQQQQRQEPADLSESVVSRLVTEALRVYDADKTGRFDFALESAGGSIASTRCTETHDLATAVYSVFGIPFWWETNSPRAILQPGASPGQCWAFKGSQGSVVIKLSGRVQVDAVSLEHISRLVAPDNKINSAPRGFAVFGLTRLDDEAPVLLGNFTYADNNVPVQTFDVERINRPFDLIELKILSNHGNIDYTCVYRFRVHGRMA